MNIFKAIFILLASIFSLSACDRPPESPQPALRKAVAKAFQHDRKVIQAMPHIFLNYLKEKRFSELDVKLTSLQQQYEQGANEWLEFRSFKQFMSPEESDTPLFNAWIAADDGLWTARLARGAHYIAVGWHKRGTEYISDTPQANIDQMEYYFSLAKQDLNAALKQRPKALVAYSLLLQIARGVGPRYAGRHVINAALKVAPASYAIREEYMTILEPKWGGSRHDMREFARDAQQWREQNPRLYALLGFEYSYIANEAQFNKHPDKAVRYYSKALKYAPIYPWLRKRADCLISLKRLDEASRDLNRLLQISPDNPRFLVKRADIYIEMGHYPSAIVDYERIHQLKPDYVSADNKLGWLYAQQNDYKRSAGYFDKTLAREPDDLYALTRCGAVRLRLQQLDRAKKCLRRALAIAPDNAFAWVRYGDVLFRLGDPKNRYAYSQYLKYADPVQDKVIYEKVKNLLDGNNTGTRQQ